MKEEGNSLLFLSIGGEFEVRKLYQLLSILFMTFLFGCGSHADTELSHQTEKQPSAVTRVDAKVTSKDITPNGALREEFVGIEPKMIEIPAIGVKTKIEKVGRTDNGEMEVPKGMDTVGWFEPGPMPGERGNAVMAGHVDSKTGPAVFYKLDQLKIGDEITVTGVKGESKVFVVTNMKSYPRKEAPVEDIFDFSYSSQLNLITCSGEFDRVQQTHKERLVIYTTLKK
ncbi:class F sortase [Bacillus sp. BGMRC 2118]|nr:class F sortase [Bacillus sp. BGMRC 2118]